MIYPFDPLEKVLSEVQSLTMSMLLFIIVWLLTEFDKFEAWNLVVTWCKAKNEGILNDSAVELAINVLTEMRNRFLFFKFSRLEERDVSGELLQLTTESVLLLKVSRVLNEHVVEEYIAKDLSCRKSYLMKNPSSLGYQK